MSCSDSKKPIGGASVPRSMKECGLGETGLQGPIGLTGKDGPSIHSLLSDRDAADTHPYTSITDIDKVFTNHIDGLTPNGHTKLFYGDIGKLDRTSVHAVTTGTLGTMPSGMVGELGIIKTFVIGETGTATQMFFGRKRDVGKLWVRALDKGGVVGPWVSVGSGVISALVVPVATPTSDTFVALTDTPPAYAAQTHKLTRVNAAASAVEFTDSINAGSF